MPLSRSRSDLHVWSCFNNVLCCLVGVLLEVLDEKTTQFSNLLPEAVMSLAPRVSWVQEFRWDTRASLWYGEVECLIVFELNRGKLS
jgi:hypothetical protein